MQLHQQKGHAPRASGPRASVSEPASWQRINEEKMEAATWLHTRCGLRLAGTGTGEASAAQWPGTVFCQEKCATRTRGLDAEPFVVTRQIHRRPKQAKAGRNGNLNRNMHQCRRLDVRVSAPSKGPKLGLSPDLRKRGN